MLVPPPLWYTTVSPVFKPSGLLKWMVLSVRLTLAWGSKASVVVVVSHWLWLTVVSVGLKATPSVSSKGAIV